MTHVKQLLAGLVVIGMLLTPAVRAAQESNSYHAVHEIMLKHSLTALNSVLDTRKVTAAQVLKATTSAETFLAVSKAEGRLAAAQENQTKVLESGRPLVDTDALGEVIGRLHAKGMSAKLTKRGYVHGITQLHERATPEQIERSRAPGGLERTLNGLVANVNAQAARLQTVSYSPTDRYRGHLQRVEEQGCGLIDAEIGLAAAIAAKSFPEIAEFIAIYAAMAALMCELSGGGGDGVVFDDNCCSAQLSPYVMRKEG